MAAVIQCVVELMQIKVVRKEAIKEEPILEEL